MTPNPTGGKLTKEIINEYREYLYQLSSDGEHPRMVDALCDMALESLKAPAVTTGERVKACGNSFGHKVALEQFTKDTVRFSCSCGKNGSTATTEAKAAELWNGINRNSPPAPLSSEAVGKVDE